MNTPASPSAVPPTPSRGRVLVVDDDRLVLATVTHGLQQAGFEVIDADNGDDAILLARHHRPDLALLDIRMEGKTGFDVAAYLRDVTRVPFMFLSAFSDAQTLRQAEDLGAVSYLVKPLDVAQIVPEVEAALNRVRLGGGSGGLPAVPAVAAAPSMPAAAPAPGIQRATEEGVALDAVSVAVGVLMHRYSTDRRQALARLTRLAQEQRLTLVQQAERIAAAVEELARGAG